MFVVKWDIRDFAPNGMMEYWNIGKIGRGIILNLINDAIQPGDKTYNESCPFENPLSHRSIIPLLLLTIFKGEFIAGQVKGYKATVLQFTEEDRIGKLVFDFVLDYPGQRPGTVCRIMALFRQPGAHRG